MRVTEIRLKIRVVVEEEENMLFAYCPDLPGLGVEAANMDELEGCVQNAIVGYIDSLIKHGDPIPVGVLESERKFTFGQAIGRAIRGALFPRPSTTDFVTEVSLSGQNHAIA